MAWNWHFQPRERHWTEQTLSLYCHRCRSRSDPCFHFHLFTHGSFLRALLFLLLGVWGGVNSEVLYHCLTILFLNFFFFKCFSAREKRELHTHISSDSLGSESWRWNVQCDHLRAVRRCPRLVLSLPFSSFSPLSVTSASCYAFVLKSLPLSLRERERAFFLM